MIRTTAANRLNLVSSETLPRRFSTMAFLSLDATSTCIIRMVALATVVLGMSLGTISNGVVDAVLQAASGYSDRSRHSGHVTSNIPALRVATILVEPYVFVRKSKFTDVSVVNSSLVEYDDWHLEHYEGFIVDLMDRVCQFLGLRYQLFLATDGEYGHLQPDNSWNGMIRQLMDREVDIIAAPLYITEQREDVIDFAVPFLLVESAVLIRKRPAAGNDAVSRANSVSDLLTLPPDVVRFGTLNAGLIIRSLRMSNSTLQRTLFARMRLQQQTSRSSSATSFAASASGFTSTNEDGIERVRQGINSGDGRGHSHDETEYAFVLPRPIADFIARRRPCDLRVIVDRELPVERWALAVPRGSGLRAQLNRAIIDLNESGFGAQNYAKWILDETDCIGSGSVGGRTNARSSKTLSSRAAAVGGLPSSASLTAAVHRSAPSMSSINGEPTGDYSSCSLIGAVNRMTFKIMTTIRVASTSICVLVSSLWTAHAKVVYMLDA